MSKKRENIRDIEINAEMIRLGQFLKYASLIESGGEAKEVIAEGMVAVNGESEFRRGRQLRHGDVVSLDGLSVRITGTTE